MRTTSEVGDVIRALGDDIQLLQIGAHQKRTLGAIRDCRTAALGGHIDACTSCGVVQISYNSCRNRHCPKCQGHKREEWIQRREHELLPIPYFHVVFTLPSELNVVAMREPKMVYDALFEASWQTIKQFARNKKVHAGMISLLHTWGQTLTLHPHVHCIVPGGGVDDKRIWTRLSSKGKYLFSVKAMSKVYRAKYVSLLRKNKYDDKALIESLFAKEWVVYAKRPFGNTRSVIEYLGRYTHKVAISNQRIKRVDAHSVTFHYKDYKAGAARKSMTLTNAEFIRRFVQHILPSRYVRIRHYGILSSTWKRNHLKALRQSFNLATLPFVPQLKLHTCPHCKTGQLITIDVFGSRGPPPHYLRDKQNAPKKQN